LGKTYGNLMVDMKATNSKLRARANRIVRIVTGRGVESADELLQQCGGELKTALVVDRAGVTVEEARRRLAAVRGRVRPALGGGVFGDSESRPGGRRPGARDRRRGQSHGRASGVGLDGAGGRPGPGRAVEHPGGGRREGAGVLDRGGRGRVPGGGPAARGGGV